MSIRQSRSPDNPGHEDSQQPRRNVKAGSKKRETSNADFLWINVQDEDPHDRDASREKQAFIRTRHHRLRKESKLRSSEFTTEAQSHHDSPATEDSSSQSEDDQYVSSTKEQSPPLCQPLDQSIALAFPYLARTTNQSMTMYLQHYHPALIQILLSTSAFHRATLHHVSGAPSQMIRSSTQDAIRLRSDTIKSIQGILVEPYKFYSEITLRVIAHIMCVEAAEANMQAVHAHERAIKKIIDGLGGLDNLGYDSLSILHVCDLMRGLTSDTPVQLNKSWKWELKVRTECLFLHEEHEIPPSSFVGRRFFNSPWSAGLHPQLVPTLRSLQKLVSLYEGVTSSTWTQTRMDNDGLLLLDHELLAIAHDCSLPAFQDTLRLTVLIYTVVRIRGFSGMPCADIFVDTLRRSLQRSFLFLDGNAPDLLLWIFFIGSLASRGRRYHAWFLLRLQVAARKLSLEQWDRAVLVLQEYLFVYRPTDGFVKEMWEFAMREKVVEV
ncbi:hypothetical protein PDE_04225 [Penicillium oxalicum 114-2]|uniref:Uncharacterized protein n=1 Tax=Penicillium oxalicum (strain 114-2 / CGMCC 5302) TaxID=933388 RepID=S7ZKS4_PENO1|nr:hypothetical protein PDE_04225 [Penicillium oxalicum 114-2]